MWEDIFVLLVQKRLEWSIVERVTKNAIIASNRICGSTRSIANRKKKLKNSMKQSTQLAFSPIDLSRCIVMFSPSTLHASVLVVPPGWVLGAPERAASSSIPRRTHRSRRMPHIPLQQRSNSTMPRDTLRDSRRHHQIYVVPAAGIVVVVVVGTASIRTSVCYSNK